MYVIKLQSCMYAINWRPMLVKIQFASTMQCKNVDTILIIITIIMTRIINTEIFPTTEHLGLQTHSDHI